MHYWAAFKGFGPLFYMLLGSRCSHPEVDRKRFFESFNIFLTYPMFYLLQHGCMYIYIYTHIYIYSQIHNYVYGPFSKRGRRLLGTLPLGAAAAAGEPAIASIPGAPIWLYI